jgi:hypothetical protein
MYNNDLFHLNINKSIPKYTLDLAAQFDPGYSPKLNHMKSVRQIFINLVYAIFIFSFIHSKRQTMILIINILYLECLKLNNFRKYSQNQSNVLDIKPIKLFLLIWSIIYNFSAKSILI